MKDFIKDCGDGFFNFCFGIGLIILVISFSFLVCSQADFDNSLKNEQVCFDFYKNNGYILDSCSKYESKLKGGN